MKLYSKINDQTQKTSIFQFQLTFDLNWGFNLCTGSSKLNVFRKSFRRDEFWTSAQTSSSDSCVTKFKRKQYIIEINSISETVHTRMTHYERYVHPTMWDPHIKFTLNHTRKKQTNVRNTAWFTYCNVEIAFVTLLSACVWSGSMYTDVKNTVFTTCHTYLSNLWAIESAKFSNFKIEAYIVSETKHHINVHIQIAVIHFVRRFHHDSVNGGFFCGINKTNTECAMK